MGFDPVAKFFLNVVFCMTFVYAVITGWAGCMAAIAACIPVAMGNWLASMALFFLSWMMDHLIHPRRRGQ